MTTTKLKRAAFKNGQVLEYLGDRQVWVMVDGKEVPLIFRGMKVTVVETYLPETGLGFIKNDEDGEPIIDHDTDGYNVYVNDYGQRRIIWPYAKNDWRIL